MRLSRVALSLVALAVGCVGLSQNDRARPTPSGERVPGVAPPRLVVVAIFDQLGASSLARLLPLLDDDGAIRTAIANGAEHRVAHRYAATYTAPGHATLHTGAAPSTNGVLANELWHAERGELSWIADPNAPVLGDPEGSASPRALRVATVADTLKAATHGRAKVVSVSVKDRGAVIPGGKAPDLALWYSGKARGFTTSRYYADQLPECGARYTRENPMEQLLAPWLPDPRVSALGGDDGSGEGEYLGWSRVFPHDPSRSDAPWSVLKLTPALTSYSIALAGACAGGLGLGDDDVPDLLSLSLSATDYAGHVYGPESQEYADALVRTDRALGRLLRQLEARTRVAVLISADHGVSPMPESSGKGGRIVPKALVAALEQRLDERLGSGDWVAAFVAPFVSLTASARSQRDQVLPLLLAELGKLDGIHAAFDARDGERLRASADPIERAVGLSLDADAPGDAFVVPAEGWSVDPDMAVGAGTSHGAPWASENEVPALFWGPGVRHLRGNEVLDSRRVAPTIAALLGVPAPPSAREPALPGAPRLAR